MRSNWQHLVREKNFSSLFANMSIAGLGLLSFMLLTRQLDQAAFGQWVLFIALASFVDLLRFGLTNTAAVRLLSNAGKKQVKVILGSSYRINLVLWSLISVICFAIFLLVDFAETSGYGLFFTWYPVLALFNLSWNNACALFQAEQNFMRMFWVKFSNTGLFTAFLALNYFYLHLGEAYILVAYLTTNLIASVYVIARQWDGLRFLKFQQSDKVKELVHFGKYSMGTLIGSSLLKSADTFIIGLSPVMGATAIAMYAIPLKLTDLLGIPLRSLTMTAYPKLSRKVIQQDLESARKTFYAYSGAITLAFIPIALVSFIFAEELILFLGGSAYRVHLEELTLIFRIFTVYTILLPIDRFTGVMLDSANQPRLNMRKVIVMTLANIVMNLIAVFAFESLLLVAVGTVLFTLLGMGLGFYYLHRVMQIKPTHILPESIHFFKNLNSFLVR